MFALDDWVRGLLGNHAHRVEGPVEGPILSTLYHLHQKIFSPVVISEMRRQIDETNFTLCSNAGLFFCFAGTTLVIGGSTKGRCKWQEEPEGEGGGWILLHFAFFA